MDDALCSTLNNFHAPISFAVAYGSRVFPQASSNSSSLIDLILVAPDTISFHRANRKQYPQHYPWLTRYLPPGTLSWVNDHLGAGITFHPYVTLESMKLKYGIISEETLIRDLTQWDTFYVSGRLQKPTIVLRPHQEILTAQIQNLKMALALALIFLPETFSATQLYHTIVQLSYTGDIRMGIAEHPEKIPRLVNMKAPTQSSGHLMSNYISEILNISGSVLGDSLYGRLYGPIISGFPDLFPLVIKHGTEMKLCQPHGFGDAETYCHNLYKLLPKSLQLYAPFNASLGKDNMVPGLRRGLSSVIATASLSQTAKGVITAGPCRSIVYGFQKVLKRIGH